MIKAVLLDMDDTLLRIDTDTFVASYLRELIKVLVTKYPSVAKSAIPADKAVIKAVRAIASSNDPMRTNGEIFRETIEQALEIPADLLQASFDEFHATTYRDLSTAAGPIPAAALLIERLTAMGLKVVIATNPLFPLTAIRERLNWAGLDSPRVPFALITHVDNMHFSKPAPQYYAEILARIGVEADEAIMVGDNFDSDMVPAAMAGLNTFWIDWGQTLPDDAPAELIPTGTGSLADFASRVEGGWLSRITPRPRTAAQVIPRLMGNVGAMYSLVTTIPAEYWNVRPAPDEWSPLESLYHLRETEVTVHRERLERIAREDNPFISQPTTEHEWHVSEGDNGLAALHAFWVERQKTIKFLESLPAAAWQRPARHSFFGATTLLELAHFTAHHDYLHITQICETIGHFQVY